VIDNSKESDKGRQLAADEIIVEQRAEDFYRRLRLRLDAWLRTRQGRAYRFADYLLLLPDFVHLIIRLVLDRRVPMEVRTQTAAVLAYIVLPFDLMPEGLVGPVGFADDLLLAALMVRRLMTTVPQEVVLDHWTGSQELMQTIKKILDVADEMVGSRLWNRLQRMVGGRQS
jgi:uncharacterized membrane protein YkvA (DUF1232 family)